MLYGPYPRVAIKNPNNGQIICWVPDYSWPGTKPRVDEEVKIYYDTWVDGIKEI